MNVKKFIFSCITVAAAFSVNAQEVKNEYVPNWYVMAQFGGQHTVGEIAFTDLNSLNAQIGVGYNFNEIWGTRLTVNGWKSKAGFGSYDWSWNYVAPMVDATLNLGNMILGYNPDRLVNFGVFAGLGANVAFKNDDAAVANDKLMAENDYTTFKALSNLWSGCKTRLAGRVGANVDFRISSKWSAGLELQANVVNDNYNSKHGSVGDWYFNTLVGVKYTIGSSNKTVSVPVVVPVDKLVDDKVKVVNNEIEDLKKRVDELEECCAEKDLLLEEKAKALAAAEPFRRDIFFTISSNVIQPTEEVKLKEVVEFMKNNPASKVEVTGYADRGTGNPTINAKYAHKRAQTVVDALKAAGISESRISESSMGDKVQPYSEPILNRVAICIVK